MPKILVLAEKPSVGREIARVIGAVSKKEGYFEGSKYIVTWAMGHLVTLADPDVYDERYKRWVLSDLPMLPKKMKLVVIPQTSKQFKIVKKLLLRPDVAEIVTATDAGREGELVARLIYIKAACKKPMKRLWISSQTDRAIKEGFAALKPSAEYDNLFKSAQARSHADWLVGLNVTRALTCKFKAQLSAGRVQTPTLALIVNREKEIAAFKPRDFWHVTIKTSSFTSIWRDDKNNSRIFDLEKAQRIAELVKDKAAVVSELTKQSKKTTPPLAYDLTELQRDANRKYAYSAKETLSIMQGLYERHKVLTYPRTDSRYIPKDVVNTLPERLKSVCIGEYAAVVRTILRKELQTKYIVNDAKVTDHHAIIPTEQPPDFRAMSGPERNIYDLVVRRFLAVLLPPLEYDEMKIILDVSGESFYASGKKVTSIGWKTAYEGTRLADKDEEDNEEQQEQSLPAVKKGDRLKVVERAIKKLATKPPARYTEATLLLAMENPANQVEDKTLSKVLAGTSGLGTPATRADIIEKLFHTFYIERSGKSLVPTSKGIQLIDMVPDDLKSATLTAKWEQQLALISTGKSKDTDFIKKMHEYAAGLVSTVKASDAKYKHDNVTGERCPDCSEYLLRVKNKLRELVVCPNPECGYRRQLAASTNAKCPNCHKKLQLRGEGEKQLFVCLCGYRERLSDFQKRRLGNNASKSEVRKYMQSEEQTPFNNSLAEQLEKWKKANQNKF